MCTITLLSIFLLYSYQERMPFNPMHIKTVSYPHTVSPAVAMITITIMPLAITPIKKTTCLDILNTAEPELPGLLKTSDAKSGFHVRGYEKSASVERTLQLSNFDVEEMIAVDNFIQKFKNEIAGL